MSSFTECRAEWGELRVRGEHLADGEGGGLDHLVHHVHHASGRVVVLHATQLSQVSQAQFLFGSGLLGLSLIKTYYFILSLAWQMCNSRVKTNMVDMVTVKELFRIARAGIFPRSSLLGAGQVGSWEFGEGGSVGWRVGQTGSVYKQPEREVDDSCHNCRVLNK